MFSKFPIEQGFHHGTSGSGERKAGFCIIGGVKIQAFVCNPFQENTFIVYDDTREALIIDPGFYSEREVRSAERFVEREGLTVKRILNTHLHFDHCCGNGLAEAAFGVKPEAYELDLYLFDALAEQAKMFGLEIPQIAPTAPAPTIKPDEAVKVGNMTFEVLHVPGHSAGSVAFYEKSEKAVFAGDVLFRCGVGRTDLAGGSDEVLRHTLLEVMFKLPPETRVFCGHGPATTIGYEL